MNKHLIDSLQAEASKLQAHGEYAQAADNYARVAAAYLDDNVLIYARYCRESFRMWLKARNVGAALQQAHNAFRVLDDTGWLKKSMEEVLELKAMIDELKAAGYGAEAVAFARELDAKLGEFGLMLKPEAGAGSPGPANCPKCGAALAPVAAGAEIKCAYCGYVIPAR